MPQGLPFPQTLISPPRSQSGMMTTAAGLPAKTRSAKASTWKIGSFLPQTVEAPRRIGCQTVPRLDRPVAGTGADRAGGLRDAD